MLQELYSDFMEAFGDDVSSATENSLTKKANAIMVATCNKYDDLEKVDKTSALSAKVDEVKSSMESNIAEMLKNTEQADSLALKSDQLNEQACVFKKKSSNLKKQMAWKNLKMTILLVIVIILVLIAILVPLYYKVKR